MSIAVQPVRRVSGAAPRNRALATFRAQCGLRSYIKVAALIWRPLNVQGEHNALHDDHLSERLRKRKTRLGTRPQRHGGNGQVQRATTESRRAARARRANPARDDERASLSKAENRKFPTVRSPKLRKWSAATGSSR